MEAKSIEQVQALLGTLSNTEINEVAEAIVNMKNKKQAVSDLFLKVQELIVYADVSKEQIAKLLDILVDENELGYQVETAEDGGLGKVTIVEVDF